MDASRKREKEREKSIRPADQASEVHSRIVYSIKPTNGSHNSRSYDPLEFVSERDQHHGVDPNLDLISSQLFLTAYVPDPGKAGPNWTSRDPIHFPSRPSPAGFSRPREGPTDTQRPSLAHVTVTRLRFWADRLACARERERVRPRTCRAYASI